MGVALSAALDNPAFLAIGVGTGISLGVALGRNLERRHAGHSPEETEQSPDAE